MPKIKTHKATAKRLTILKSGKVRQRKAGQDHFNARDTGKAGTKKRRDINTPKTFTRTIKSLTPYN